MNLSPEIKAQLAEQKKSCIYCQIVSKEKEGKTVFEDDITLAILDVYPIIKGHTVFTLKEHYPITPYIPPEDFKHFFAIMPQLLGAVKKGMVRTGVNMFIAAGNAAGQYFPHFLVHIFPRENGDKFFNYLFEMKHSLDEEKLKTLQHNFPIMMANHFKRNPMSWHTGIGVVPEFLKPIAENNQLIYEDEQVLCVLPEKGAVAGHIEIYSKVEEKYVEKLSAEESFHLFSTASLAATLVFEGLGAHGTNIILKSGESDDNQDGKLVIHILPRTAEDEMNSKLLWQPKQPDYDLNSIQSKIKDQTWKIKYQEENVEQKEEVVVQPAVVKTDSSEKQPVNSDDEIKKAIERMKH
jgi:histidine triad (HIT) family protein